MALYRTGTAAMDAQGVITGTNTKWREPLSLIRTGATIVFLTTPLKLAVISDIVSNTEMRAIQTDGEAVGDGNYVILLNDSLTVDGMAQDVAETLRYYQSKETMIEDAMEFFKDFDLKTLQDLVSRAEDAALKTEQDRIATEQLKNQSQQIKNDTDAIKTQTQQIKDSAVAETTSIRNEAFDARDMAEEHMFAAESAKNAADIAKTGAETARDAAEQFASSVNPELLLHKNNNLSDLADRAAAWLNVRPLGSTPLSGDPVNDYDAATKRWTENLIGAGTTGPTMNGVMNFGVGQVTLWNSRSYIPPYCVTADGQLLKRADWPELWAHAQQHGVVSDAEWLALKPGSQPSYRAKFSSGDGSTTFRVPDLNGVQNGTPKGLFPRGDSGLPSENGKVYEACAPNIEGRVGFPTKGDFGFGLMVGDPRGAFYNAGGTGSRFLDPQLATDSGGEVLGLSAHESDNVYGRYGVKDNILPRNFVGVWIIRASGGFTAANTKWSVINGDKDVPPSNVNVYGGEISSEYHVGGKIRVKSSIITRYSESGEITPIIRITDARGESTSYYDRPVRDAYQVSNTGTGGQSLNIVKNFTRGWQTVARRFPVTCPPQSATNWHWDFVSEGASTFINYPGLSVSGESGNSADWDVKCESLTPSSCSGFIHNRSSATLVIWVLLIATGVIQSTWKE